MCSKGALGSSPMTKRRQLLVLVDVDADVVADELTALMPDRREQRDVIRFTEIGAPRLERRTGTQQPVDWPRIAAAVEAAAAKVRQLSDGDLSLDVYVGGFAPLAVFAHLGYALSKFGGNQTVLHRDFGGGEWKAYPLADAAQPSPAQIFDAPSSMPVSPSIITANVAVYVDLNGRATPVGAIQQLHEAHAMSLGAIVDLRTTAPTTLNPQNAAVIARELVQELGRLPSFFPHGAGITLCLAVPSPVAFMAGRALNPTIATNVRLTNFFAGTYELTTMLPFEEAAVPNVGFAAEDVEARSKVRDLMSDALQDLKNGVHLEDMPAEMEASLQTQILDRLAKLAISEATNDEFGLSIAHASLSFGTPLLEALRGADEERVRRFGQLLVLHELLHTDQGLRTTNFRDVGRAGVVLEQVDFAADVFALRVTTARAFRENPGARVRDVAVAWFEVAVQGIGVFDRLLEPSRIRELPERRLRRYLIWHLQLQRARTVDVAADVESLLKASLTVELAPLPGKLSPRYDKVVLEPTSETVLFCAVDGHLIRRAAQGTFDPRLLVEAVRSYNHELLQTAMHAIVEENAPVLAPWVP